MLEKLIDREAVRLGPTVMVAAMLIGHYVHVIDNKLWAAYAIAVWGIAWMLLPRPMTVVAMLTGAFVIGCYVGRL